MSTVQRIARNTAALLISQVLSYVVGFFSVMLSARYLGAGNYGVLSFALAFTGIFAIVADLGVGALATRDIARDKSLTAKYVANLSVIKTISVAVTFALIALTINLMNYPQQSVNVVYLAGLALVITSFSQMFYGIFIAYERMEYQSIGQFLYSAAMLVGIVLAIKFSLGVVGFAMLWCFASALVFLYCLAIYRLKFAPLAAAQVTGKARIDWSFSKSLVRAGLPLLLASIFGVISYRIDMVMLSLMKGDAAVGLYSAAYRLIETLGFIPMAFTGALYPVLSQLHISAQDSLKFAYQKSFQYLLLIGLPLAVGTTLIADRVIIGIYSAEFSGAASALRILVWVTPFSFLSWLLVTMLISINRQGLMSRVTFLGMVLNVIGNLILIPRYSYTGASIATVATAALACALYLYFTSRLVCRVELRRLVIKPVVACGVMAGSVILLQHLNLFLVIPVAIVIYFGVLFLLRTFSREDLDLLRQMAVFR